MMNHFAKPLVLAGLCIFVCSACGDGKSSASFSKTVACSVLTSQDASQFLGVKAVRGSFVGGSQTPTGQTSQCSYISNGGVAPDDVLSLVIQRDKKRPQSVDETLRALRTRAYKGQKTKTIRGLGSGAFLVTTSASQQLNVLTDKDYVILSVGPNKDEKSLEMLDRKILKELAKVKGS